MYQRRNGANVELVPPTSCRKYSVVVVHSQNGDFARWALDRRTNRGHAWTMCFNNALATPQLRRSVALLRYGVTHLRFSKQGA